MLYTEAQKQEHIEEILTLLYQVALRDSRIPVVLPGKTYTEEAALAVRAFQQAYGLPVTGEIDDATWNAIAAAYHSLLDAAQPLVLFPAGTFILQEGDRGDLVHLVQILIRLAAGHYANLEPIPVTGIFDAETAAAVRQLQRIAGLPESGAVDRQTWNRLAALINSLPLRI